MLMLILLGRLLALSDRLGIRLASADAILLAIKRALMVGRLHW